ncbi:MAG: 3,4-dihydroxy-2-butanone-4-phosphate synthase [Deltaproteobacteria bacterium]|nr:3,4-dihydroxy-2-butanone-4-phosphate synthase [Deltaproteobacteria bacterium]
MTSQDVATSRVNLAIQAIKNGGMVIMVDDEDRENEGDLVFAAASVSAAKINFMTKEARGLICLSLTEEAVDQLQLPMMEDSSKRLPSKSTAFTVSIEARDGVSTGISAADRAHTIKVATSAGAKPEDLVVPGHIFPLKARRGGVLQRAGHTEGSIDLVRLAGLAPAAVICEIMNDDGTMARMPDLEGFAKRHDMPIVTIADLISYRLHLETMIQPVAKGVVTTAFGEFQSVLFKSDIDGLTHLAIIKGEQFDDYVTEVRVHRQRPLQDVFGVSMCTSRLRLDYSLELLRNADHAVLIYLTQADAQASLAADFEILTRPRESISGAAIGAKHAPMDPRQLGIGAQLLRNLGVRRMRVHRSHAAPLKGLVGFGLELVGTVEIPSELT